ncbi:enoyl-CoA hydratase/isomerase family protein [Candidatus Acetothermia bacterium]|nr:enoyl-CoA hydratase/isomerase family protein [Candidatus Acetothermia bacterium]
METKNYQHLLVDQKNGVARVTLNRPDVRNALNEVLIAELTDCFSKLSANMSVRVVVLHGAGPVFCAGGDLHWMQRSINFSPEENRRDARGLAEMYRAIDECAQPLIASVHGAALGGGMGMCSVSDIVLSMPDTQFGFTEVKLGIVPAVISPFVLKKIGEANARRYFLTSELFNADIAKQIGLVHEILPADQLDARADTLAQQILSNGPQAVREAKKLIRNVMQLPLDTALDHAVELIARLRTSPEGQEGLRAFLEKRPPRWRQPSQESK